MKLHWSPRSPYVRKVMIAAHELGLADRLRCVRTVVSPFAPAEELFADNPLNKLPTLVLDVLMVRLVERLRPEAQRSPAIVAHNERKTAAVLDRLEADAARLEERPFDIGHVAIGTALGYVDFRFASDSWRNTRPKLAGWHAKFLERPSVRAVPVRDDS